MKLVFVPGFPLLAEKHSYRDLAEESRSGLLLSLHPFSCKCNKHFTLPLPFTGL